jgi:AcrR family transcriptional regulator
MKVIKRRNRAMTMERILRAMGDVIVERGTEKAGINAVAEKAQVNKVLIYRYFGGWNGLLEAYVQRGFFLSMLNDKFIESVPDKIPAADSGRVWSHHLLELFREFRERKSSQDLVRWEMLNGETEIARRLAAFRDASYQKMIDKIGPFAGQDPEAITAILVSGVTFLTLIGNQREEAFGINLRSEEGIERLEDAMQTLLAGVDKK